MRSIGIVSLDYSHTVSYAPIVLPPRLPRKPGVSLCPTNIGLSTDDLRAFSSLNSSCSLRSAAR